MPSPSHEEFLSRGGFGSLNGIRCLSITAVIWHHTVSGVDWLPITRRGFLGVDMFFVLSGFLIVTLLLRERDRTGQISLKKFYARRALRIFPVYYGLLAVMSVLFGVVSPQGKTAGPFFAELAYYVSYTANWVVLHSMFAIAWSLAAEEQFYLIWPPIERFARRIAVPLLLIVIFLNQLVNFGYLDSVLEGRMGLARAEIPMLQATFTPISLGVLLAHVLHSRAGFERVGWLLSRRWMSPLALALVIALSDTAAVDIAGWTRLSIQVAMAVFLASCVVCENHVLNPMLTLWPVARVGIISYGVYLYHPLARHAAEALVSPTLSRLPLALFVACFLVSVVVADLSYRYYESWFLQMKERFHVRKESCSAAA